MISKRKLKLGSKDLKAMAKRFSLAIEDAGDRVRSNPTDLNYVQEQNKKRVEWYKDMLTIQAELMYREAQKIARMRKENTNDNT